MKNNRLVGGILLISGITIGAAMLALPISTGMAGYWPALVIFVACWLLMYWTACLLLEVVLSFKSEVNLISMAQKTLGPVGAGVAWCGFLLLLYALLAAYMTGSGPLFAECYEDVVGRTLPTWLGPLPIVIVFGPFVYVGLSSVDFLNRYLMAGLIITYVLMLALLAPRVDPVLLQHVDMDFALLSFAVLITAFGYHTIIPSLTTYLGGDVKAVKRCILWGSAVPLVIYVLWETLILGNVPLRGDVGLAAIFQSGGSLSRTLEHRLQSPVIGYGMRTFALLAIITSFIGVAQSLFDFLRDGLKIDSSKIKGRVGVWFLTFVPPLLFVMALQKEFVTVLEYAGVFVAILIGILPIAMVVSARYVKRLESPYRAPGGAVALVAGFVAFLAIIALVVATNAGMMTVDVTRYVAAS